MNKKNNGWKFFAVFLLGTVLGLLASPSLNGINIYGDQIVRNKSDDLCEENDCDCEDCEPQK